MTQEEEAGEKICHFIANYVVKVYGVKSVGDCLHNNKGDSFLDMMLMDDVAYCISLVHNSQECWLQDLEIKDNNQEEQMNHRCWSDLPDSQERDKYKMKEARYSGGKGVNSLTGK